MGLPTTFSISKTPQAYSYLPSYSLLLENIIVALNIPLKGRIEPQALKKTIVLDLNL